MRYLVYLITLLLFSTAVAQNPTIVQGNYISNVFGQSNFVLNPNAQSNVLSVTPSGGGSPTATVTRSTTTPLVATTEFNVSTSTATGYLDWTLRTFDAGMKNQNCEARFTYRGFAVATTTAQIVQGSNVVAQLALTASTDPRIASINFPCGDLSSATTLRVQQATASLTGTNEIGGIYVGLATNQANVAQAEAVVRATRSTSQTIPNGTATVVYSTALFDNLGEYNTSNGKFTAKRAGRYYVSASILWTSASVATNEVRYLQINKNGSAFATSWENQQITSTRYITSQINSIVELAVGDYIEIVAYQNSGGNRDLHPDSVFNFLAIARFPTSSELVVTPERQGDWWISGIFTGGLPLLGTTTASSGSFNEITHSSLSFNPDSGSQPVATLCSSTNAPPSVSTSATTCAAGNESLGVTFNIPSVGAYEVCSEFSHSFNVGANGTVDDSFSLQETATNNNVALTTKSSLNSGHSYSSAIDTFTNTPLKLCETFNFTSIGQKAVRLMYAYNHVAPITQNQLIANGSQGNRNIKFTVQQITGKSNSALYVQGPVKAAETGAAIPAGYVGEEIVAEQNSFVTTGLANNLTTGFLTISLTPGVWLISSSQTVLQNSSTGTALCNVVSDVSTSGNTVTGAGLAATESCGWPSNNVSSLAILTPPFVYKTTTTKTIYLNSYALFTAGTPSRRGTLRAVRIN